MCLRMSTSRSIFGQLLERETKSRPRSWPIWAWPLSVRRTSSVGTARLARRWSKEALRATRIIQAGKGNLARLVLVDRLHQLAKMFWVMSSAS